MALAGAHSIVRSANHETQRRRRFLEARFGLSLLRVRLVSVCDGPASRATDAAPPALLATRMDQYSHERMRPVVLELIWPASFVSPGDSVAMSAPIVSARTWYSALRAEKTDRNTQSRTLMPATVTPCRIINTIQCLPSARASEAPSSGFTTSILVSPNSSRWSQNGGRIPPTAPR